MIGERWDDFLLAGEMQFSSEIRRKHRCLKLNRVFQSLRWRDGRREIGHNRFGDLLLELFHSENSPNK